MQQTESISTRLQWHDRIDSVGCRDSQWPLPTVCFRNPYKLREAKPDVVHRQLDDQVRERVLQLLAALMARRAADAWSRFLWLGTWRCARRRARLGKFPYRDDFPPCPRGRIHPARMAATPYSICSLRLQRASSGSRGIIILCPSQVPSVSTSLGQRIFKPAFCPEHRVPERASHSSRL